MKMHARATMNKESLPLIVESTHNQTRCDSISHVLLRFYAIKTIQILSSIGTLNPKSFAFQLNEGFDLHDEERREKLRRARWRGGSSICWAAWRNLGLTEKSGNGG